jgi:hypothetical protein
MPILLTPVEDEYLLGLVARLTHVNIEKSPVEMLKVLINHFNVDAKHKLVDHCRFRAEAYLDALALSSGKTLSAFLVDHSNFFAEGFPEKLAARWLLSMLSESNRGAFVRFKRLRLCSECVTQQWRDFGVPFWDRKHQLDGVFWCPVHKIPLLEAEKWLEVDTMIPTIAFASQRTPATARDLEQYPALQSFSDVMTWFLRHPVHDLHKRKVYNFLISRSQANPLCRRILNVEREPGLSKFLNDIAFNQCPSWWLEGVFGLQQPIDDQRPFSLYSVFSRHTRTPHVVYALLIALLLAPRERANLLYEASYRSTRNYAAGS